MESNGSCWAAEADSILDQLLKFATQLAEFENDPQVNIKALSEECTRRIEDLKRLVPEDFIYSAATGSEILEKMRALYERTQACLDILHRKRDAVSASLKRLSKTKQAVNAYGSRRTLCG